ncbi:DUF1015 domain-containing protein [Amycolatopsis sp. AA4]|uniref:DUF1015 family protein n=1 Tax=Actinomycetes TaxID=1760 RepID=UPI0001DEE2FA|nr:MULTISPECIES: DUF1015 family protein [Actinomycetes]ATY11305.1 DUF1015 domain-containing protein [Amycolatopsis sp. AA4]EFL06904.1 predicted protein [Streptomyces sp. AA4]
MDRWVRPIERGWVVQGAVPGPDVDEFAEPEAVTRALATARGDTLLAAQHPARTPAALAAGLDVEAALPEARATLERLLTGHYRPETGFVAAYRIGETIAGVLCLVDVRELTSAGAHVKHTEEVYPEVVAERAAVLDGLGCATSAALLVPVGDAAELTAAVKEAAGSADPDVSTVDRAGLAHELWVVRPGELQERLLDAASASDLLVADGNHRVAAAAGSGQLLALVTAGSQLEIRAINRVLLGTGHTAESLYAAWQAAGLDVAWSADATPPGCPGTAVVLAGSRVLRMRLPESDPLIIDHEVVEQTLLGSALGLDPDGPHVRPLLPGSPVPPDADAVVQLAPVPFETVRAVHAAGRRMPRKATYFTPKPRGGLVLARW